MVQMNNLGGQSYGSRSWYWGTYGAMPELFLKLNQLIAAVNQRLQFCHHGIIGVLTFPLAETCMARHKEALRINEGSTVRIVLTEASTVQPKA